jgi:hypothetical protein
MTLLGGLGTLSGPVVGAFIIVGIQNYLAEIGAWVTIVQGAVFVLVVLAFRRGIVGELIPLVRKWWPEERPDGLSITPGSHYTGQHSPIGEKD